MFYSGSCHCGAVEFTVEGDLPGEAMIQNLKLERNRDYLKDVHGMVEMCRTNEGVYIPPSWLKPDQAKALAKRIGVPIGNTH